MSHDEIGFLKVHLNIIHHGYPQAPDITENDINLNVVKSVPRWGGDYRGLHNMLIVTVCAALILHIGRFFGPQIL